MATIEIAAPQSERLLHVVDLAEEWDVSTGTIYRLVKSGELRAIRIGRLVRIPQSAVNDFLESP